MDVTCRCEKKPPCKVVF